MIANAKRYDAVVVGGGHNGLVCAAYLAAGGLSVCVLERRTVVGGAATTEEFLPGFRNSVNAYTVSLLHPKIIRELKLAQHGLRIVLRPYSNFLPLPGPDYIKVGGGLAATQAEVARFSRRDADGRIDIGALLDAWKTARAFRVLDLAGRRDVVDLFAKSAGDVLDRWFESDPIKAAFGWDSIVGNFASPYTPGSAYVLLHHVFGEVNGQRGQWGHAMGGMGTITQAMARECEARGVALRTGAGVARVVVKAGRAAGVELDDGEVVEANRVVANVNPKLLFGKLVAAEHLDADFRARIDAYKCASGTFRMNVALSALPDFAAHPGASAQPHHASGIVVAPSLAYMERAYFDAKTFGWSRAPVIEVLIPSVVDDSLAPAGIRISHACSRAAHGTTRAIKSRT